MKRFLLVPVFLGLVFSLVLAGPGYGQRTFSRFYLEGIEGDAPVDNLDMPGMDYRNFDLPNADPLLCRQACKADAQCRSFTYVKPGFQGPKARCWLKNGFPAGVANPCCMSERRASTTTAEENEDRPGMDYRNFDLTGGQDLIDCRKACNQDARCEAYTYVKPGIQGPNARCWLKSGIPGARSNACCVSGVKTWSK